MNKQATGVSDLLRNIGIIPQNGRDYSYIDDAIKNTLIGGGVGAAALGGAGELFSNEQDPEKRKLNLRNNLLMGAGLGAGGGMLYSGARNLFHSKPTGMENSVYNLGRGAQSFLGNGGVALGAGGVRGYLQNAQNKAVNKTVSELNDPKFKFNNTFLPEKSPVNLPMERVLQPNQDTITSAKTFVDKARESSSLTHPKILDKILNKFHLSNADMGTVNFDVPNTPDAINAEFAKPESVLHKIYNSNPQSYPSELTPESINEKLRNTYLNTARDQIFGNSSNPSVPKVPAAGGNVFSRLWGSLTGGGSEKLTQAIKRPDALLNRINNPSIGDKAMSFMPFSNAGKLSASPLAAASRTAIPTYGASWLVNQMAPHTTDPLFGGDNWKRTLIERGLNDRTEQIRQGLQSPAK